MCLPLASRRAIARPRRGRFLSSAGERASELRKFRLMTFARVLGRRPFGRASVVWSARVGEREKERESERGRERGLRRTGEWKYIYIQASRGRLPKGSMGQLSLIYLAASQRALLSPFRRSILITWLGGEKSGLQRGGGDHLLVARARQLGSGRPSCGRVLAARLERRAEGRK